MKIRVLTLGADWINWCLGYKGFMRFGYKVKDFRDSEFQDAWVVTPQRFVFYLIVSSPAPEIRKPRAKNRKRHPKPEPGGKHVSHTTLSRHLEP